ncbi:MAG TPA: hypothetical protein PLS95_01295 [Thermoanaerobaculales bacterium]|nr:hypothetical protein [Thermoanaerobaculales bacterium]HQN96608.1 hypothetical protein [Thermoanaerobaculales bacterium]HQP44281.1 hypothetical protein [Thermoanaerobaculales bacterium]
MGARTLLKVLVAWSAVLSAAACDVEFIAGPSHVKNGEPVQYQVLVTAAEAATNATVHLAGDVPAGWILDSATFLTSVSGGASGGLTVHPSNPGVITGLPAVPPGHRRIYLSAGPFTTITADDAGTALLDFTAAGAQGSYTMTFWAGVSTQPGEPGESYSKSLSVTPPMPPDAIFTDGFESGTTEGWSLRAGVDPSTVAYLPLDGDAHDESAYGNDGTAIGDPVATANRFDAPGAALLFDGVDDQIIIPDAPSLDLEQAVTLAAWIRPAPTGNHYVVGKINLTGSGFLYALDYLLGAASGRFRDAQGGGGPGDRVPAHPTRGVAAAGLHLGRQGHGLLRRRCRRGPLRADRHHDRRQRRRCRDRLLRGRALPRGDRRGADHEPGVELPRGGEDAAVGLCRGRG